MYTCYKKYADSIPHARTNLIDVVSELKEFIVLKVATNGEYEGTISIKNNTFSKICFKVLALIIILWSLLDKRDKSRGL